MADTGQQIADGQLEKSNQQTAHDGQIAGVSLWTIEATVLELSEIIESPDTSDEEKNVAKQELAKWVEASVMKVDRVRAFLKHCEIMESAAKDEAAAMKARAEKWGNRARRLKDLCLAAMNAAGKKRVEGRSGVLRIQANGGKQPMNITNESLIPETYRLYKIHLNAGEWLAIQKLILDRPNGERTLREIMTRVTSVVDEQKVRHELESKCEQCGGAGRLISTPAQNVCAECDGSGRKRVPGAELESRGEHLRCE